MFDRRALGAVALATLSLSLAVAPAVSAMPSGSLAPHAAQSGPVTVEATARAASAAEARKEAIVAALRKIVGEYVEADVEIADDEVVKNELLSFSNAGGVKSEQVGDVKLVGDEVEVTMRVTVEPKPLVARVKGAAKVGAKLDGAALAAEIAAAKDDHEAKKRVLDKAFADLPDAFMTIRIVDSEGKDTKGIDRKLVQVDKKTGEATVTIPIVLGFDMAVWKNNVYPALDQVLTAAANKKIVDGLIVDRGNKFHGSDETLNQVRFTGTRTIHNPTARGNFLWDMNRPYAVALLRENLGRGRQLNFDLFEFDKDELPMVAWHPNHRDPVSAVTPRSLRIRLSDGDGEAVDGRDVQMGQISTDGPSRWLIGSRSIFGEPSDKYGYTPFAWTAGRRVVAVAPMWGADGGVGLLFTEAVVPVNFTLPAEDLELIEKIEVELIKPAGN